MIAAAGQLMLGRVKPTFLQDIGDTLIVLVLFLIFLLIILEGRNFLRSSTRSLQVGNPLPGPRGVPVFGNVFQFGTVIHETFVKMSKQYGDVFRVHIGSRMVVVLNGYDTIHQALVKQAKDFAGRPDDLTTFKFINTFSGIPTLSFMNYDESWKLHRKIAESSFRHFTGLGKQSAAVEDKVREEALDLISFLTDNNNSDGNVIDPETIIKASVANILYSLMFNKRRSLDDEVILRFLSMSEKFSRAAASGNPVDFMPWMKYFPNKTLQDFKDIIIEQTSILDPEVDEHLQKYQDGSEKDMLDHLTTASRSVENQQELKRVGVTEAQILHTVRDFFGAGFETVSTTLYWFILYLIKNPDWQEKIRQELDEVVGSNRSPSLTDRGNLPHTEAFIHEVFRHSNVVPMSIPHSTTKDTTLNGYFIPENTVVFVNLHSVGHDENMWENPGTFNPSRFFNETASGLDPAKTGLLMPFGAGRRRCIGSELARAELFLYCTHLVHQCKFEAPEGQNLDSPLRLGLTIRPSAYKVKVSQR